MSDGVRGVLSVGTVQGMGAVHHSLSSRLQSLAKMFVTVGMCEQAVHCYIKVHCGVVMWSGDVGGDVECGCEG